MMNARTIPVIVYPQKTTSLAAWAAENSRWTDDTLRTHGAILFRDFDISGDAAFAHATTALCDHLIDYVYRSTPRTAVTGNVYTASEYSPKATIPLHNENSYQDSWPMKIIFGCITPSASGGETPIALTTGVTARIDPDVVRMFESRRVMYIRTFGQGVDLPWQTAFQTSDSSQVETYCRQHSIVCDWLDGGRLRTKQVCNAIAYHPLTGDKLWFNQAHIFHPSSLGTDSHQALLEIFSDADLPRNARFGDGGAIPEDVLQHIRSAYEKEATVFPWAAGDVLLLDNMLVAHGRAPFSGTRRILVAMGEPTNAVRPSAPSVV